MASLHPLSYRKVAKALTQHGFAPTHQRGSHVRFQHHDGRWTVVPRHDRRPIPPGLLRIIQKQANLPPDTFRSRR